MGCDDTDLLVTGRKLDGGARTGWQEQNPDSIRETQWQRLVLLNPKSRSALGTYLVRRAPVAKRDKIEPTTLFFPVRVWNRYAGVELKSLSTRSVDRMLLHMTKVRGLQPMHPHLLRPACATHKLDNGCPLDVISHILGHDNLDVTAHYAQVSTRLMMKEYNGAHPHAKL